MRFEGETGPVPVRYSDPPPPGVEPDPDYEPEAGEWYWWYWKSKKKWLLHHRTKGVAVMDADGDECDDIADKVYKGKMLPATAPEENNMF